MPSIFANFRSFFLRFDFRGDSVAVSPIVGYAVNGDALAAFWAAMCRSPPDWVKAVCVIFAAKWANNDDVQAGYPA